MRKYLTLVLLVLSAFMLSATLSSCFMFRRHGTPQFRQQPPPRTNTTSYNRKGVRTKTKDRNYKNQYRSDYRGHRGGRDPYHYRQSRYRY
ncbi:MAG: hypothetical protein QM530_07750 [Phycisphaerales bacterium]|nr:hypothetical protein [Phycisphaerales bacterium]